MVYEKMTSIGKRFLVLDKAEGSMSNIYFCFDLDINEMRPCVLKGLKPSYTQRIDNYQAIFRSEAITWMGLGKHENIVRCLMTVEEDGESYLLLEWVYNEYLFGIDLRHWIQKRAILLADALQFAAGICDGLMYANRQLPGIVHRDLKPENVLIGTQRTPLITDFGLANLLSNANMNSLKEPQMLSGTVISGKIVGTPPYMAPEQWQTPEVDHRVDIYALGCILYEMITGEMAFGDIDRLKVRQLHETGPLPTIPFVPQPINELIHRCLAKRPEERFQTFDAVRSRIVEMQELVAYSAKPQPLAPAELQANDYGNRAVSYANLEQYDLAFEYWEKAFQLNPRLARGYNNRGGVYTKLERFDEAIHDFNTALEVNPDFVEALINRGGTYLKMKQTDLALADLNHALRLNPVSIDGLVNRGSLYRYMGNVALALQDANDALRLNPQFGPALELRATLHVESGNMAQAIEDLNRAIELDGNNSQLLIMRGTARLAIRDARGVDDLIQSQTVSPARPVPENVVRLLVSFTESMLQQGLSRDVVEYFSFIRQNFGERASINMYMGELFEKYGYIPEALVCYALAKSLGDETANSYLKTAAKKLYEMPEEQMVQRLEIANSYRKWHPDPDEFLQQSLQKFDQEQYITLDDLDEALRKVLSIQSPKRAREVAMQFPFVQSPEFQLILEEMYDTAPQVVGQFIILAVQFLREVSNEDE